MDGYLVKMEADFDVMKGERDREDIIPEKQNTNIKKPIACPELDLQGGQPIVRKVLKIRIWVVPPICLPTVAAKYSLTLIFKT